MNTNAHRNNNLYHNKKAQWATYIVFFALLAAIPVFVPSAFLLNQLARYCVYGMLAVSVSLVWGFGGILSLGQGIAFGLAAYGMGMTMMMQSQDPISNPIPGFMLSNELDHLPLMWEPFWSPTVGVGLALLVPTVFFMIFGTLMFQARVAGVFVAIMTLAELAALYFLVYDMQPFTGGFPGLPAPAPFNAFGISLDPYTPLGYWLAVGLLAFTTLCTKALLQSKFGLIVQATRDDPERVRFLGYSVSLYQIVVYTISGVIAALAGIWWVMLTQFVSPTALETNFSIAMVIWAAVGGRRSLFGAIIGAFLVNGLQSYAGDTFLDTWMLILGAIFILVVRFLPMGLAGLFETVIGYVSTALVTRPKTHLSTERLHAAE